MNPTDAPPSEGLRARRRAETAAEIVDAARFLFAEWGYATTRTADIARRAGVSEATLFRYFPSKSAIALAATGERMDFVLERLANQPADLDEVSAARVVLAELETAQLFGLDDPAVAEIALVVAVPELRPALDARINAAAATVAEALARRAGRRVPSLADRVRAHSVVGAVQAAAEAWLADMTGPSFLELLAEAFDVLDGRRGLD